MKFILRIVISALIVALIVVLCIFVFFKPNNAMVVYNVLNQALSQNGAITQMENTIKADSNIKNTFPNYIVIEGELVTLKQEYGKALLYDKSKEVNESLKEYSKKYVDKVKDFNKELENYKLTLNSGNASANLIQEMVNSLESIIKEQCAMLSKLNILLFDNLIDGYYHNAYSFNTAVNFIASIYSEKINADHTDVARQNYITLQNTKSTNTTDSSLDNFKTYDGENKFINYCWELDLKKVFKETGDTYINSLAPELKQKALYVKQFITDKLASGVAV